MNTTDEPAYTAEEVAAMTGLSASRVRHIGADYGIGRIENRRRVFTRADIDRIMAPRPPGWHAGVTGYHAHRRHRRGGVVP